jgi:hypothetical protein
MTIPYEEAGDQPNGGLLLPESGRHGSPYSEGEKCQVCKSPARHKVGEEDTQPDLHNWTTYLCCHHFGIIMGPVAYRDCQAVVIP